MLLVSVMFLVFANLLVRRCGLHCSLCLLRISVAVLASVAILVSVTLLMFFVVYCMLWLLLSSYSVVA